MEHIIRTEETLQSGNIRVTLKAEQGYKMYFKSEYEELEKMIERGDIEGDIWEYIYLFEDFFTPETYDFNNIGVILIEG